MDQAGNPAVDSDHERVERYGLGGVGMVLPTRSGRIAGSRTESTNLDVIGPIEQGDVGIEIAWPKVGEADASRVTFISQDNCSLVIQVVKSGPGVAKYHVFGVPGEDLDTIQFERGTFERGAMVKNQQVGRGKPLHRLRIPDHDAMANA